VFLQKSTNSGL